MGFDFAIQSTRLHVAIIMDGNGRWAVARGLERIAGHQAGVSAVRRAVEAAPGVGIGTLTLYAFSSDNWRRPPDEVSFLMRLLRAYLEKESERCVANGVRVEMIGRRDRLGPELLDAIRAAEAATAAGERLRLQIALDYSARDAIVEAARDCRNGDLSRDGLASRLGAEVDLLIRTGGEQRLSDFMLWECAYAELVFMKRLWPDFDSCDLESAVREFQGRQRRFGRLPPQNGHRPAGLPLKQASGWLD